MKICLLEPFFTGSHRAWAEGLARSSRHQIRLATLPGRHWKWRMFGGAVALAEQQSCDEPPDLLLASDMLDLSTFLALTRHHTAHIPAALYFHENQITYPWAEQNAERNNQYGFLNYTSALAADAVFFNSLFHKNAFLEALPRFLSQFPDRRQMGTVQKIAEKSAVLPLGMDLKKADAFRTSKPPDRPPLILWNHRWEYDKNPDLFFQTLFRLKAEGLDFQVAVLGESFARSPAIFEVAQNRLGDRIVHFGHVPKATYWHWLWQSDILPVTSQQDFFGGSVVEAIYCGCSPILPDRLAFPEHVPPRFRAACLYGSPEGFYARLRAAILASNDKKPLPVFPDFVEKYDWSTLAPVYDDALTGVRRRH
ncbi:MAG: DUF3524 domain-containing protein [Bacteroidetes bacterium]|nr:MAG: DUF3524 domain-containing protein [Bacteroidota bacterium]